MQVLLQSHSNPYKTAAALPMSKQHTATCLSLVVMLQHTLSLLPCNASPLILRDKPPAHFKFAHQQLSYCQSLSELTQQHVFPADSLDSAPDSITGTHSSYSAS